MSMHADRCSSTGQSLQQAIAQSVQSSDAPSRGGMNGRYLMGGSAWRPVWRKNGSEEAGNFYTIRVVNGQRQVIKQRSAHWYAALCWTALLVLPATPQSHFSTHDYTCTTQQ